MEFGVMLSTFGDRASPQAFQRIARTAERSGFDSVWVGDHVTIPAHVPDEYPFSSTGKAPFDASSDAYEPFQVLSHLAAVTDTIDVGTNACVVPYRHPATLVQHAFTLESLSDGRFDFGVVPGWLRTEFEVLDVPFEDRGSRTDEFLELFDRARDRGILSFDGPHHSFQETGFHPTPAEGRPKVWIGGRSSAAFRRVAEFGDGWTIFWDRPADLSETRERILRARDDFDRRDQPEIAVVRGLQIGPDVDRKTNKPFVGEAASMFDDIDEYAAAGATRVVFQLYDSELEARIEQIERFGNDVIDQL